MKAALAFSGGGAVAAYQVTAERYAATVAGYEWSVIAGVSAGALNAAMIAQGKRDRLLEAWQNITRSQVLTGALNAWAVVRLALGAKSIYGNDPLRKLIWQEIEPARVKIPLRIGVVDLRTGDYLRFSGKSENLREAVLASTTIPIAWSPAKIPPYWDEAVDGGLRNISPLGDVLDTDPDEVVIINCRPRRPLRTDERLSSAVKIGLRSLDIALNEILQNDVNRFLEINRLVAEAETQGAVLHNANGKVLKRYRATLIEPKDDLGGTLDFSRTMIRRRLEAGWVDAEAAFSGNDAEKSRG